MQRQIQQLVAAACISTFATVSAGCASPDNHKKTANLTPVQDTAPYWCQLIPKSAIQNITGMSQGLTQDRDIDPQRQLSSCQVSDEKRLPLEVQLALDGEAKFQENETFSHHRSEMRLPPALGRSFFQSAPEVPNFTVAAAFHCGTKPIWIEIVLRLVQQGRDVKVDLPALLKIAEGRYSSLAKCKIKA